MNEFSPITFDENQLLEILDLVLEENFVIAPWVSCACNLRVSTEGS